ncbi:MAG: hypothetical protein IPK82_16645 [Polyangiaceae bacterium]|nr:hypothetical protein [Polyangiaceae bacterium]
MNAAEPAPRLNRTHLAILLGARLVVAFLVFAFGFRAVSDDDFSRVVIAQSFAHTPKLDPTGTSWLPFPFWITGGAMFACGTSLWVARVTAFLLSLFSSFLIARATLLITRNAVAAVATSVFCSLIGWSAWLGVATVPELFTASLTLFAASTLASKNPLDRSLGAFSLLAATLSRYEPWPVAAAFAIANLVLKPTHIAPFSWAKNPSKNDKSSESTHSGEGAPTSYGAPRAYFVRRAKSLCVHPVVTSLLATVGPIVWILWNRIAHNDPFHFVARVTAYKRALGVSSSESTLARLLQYPAALLREMPEVLLLALLALVIAARSRSRKAPQAPAARSALLPTVAPLALALVQIGALSLALVNDGAPTHHPERAVLFPALALAVAAAAILARTDVFSRKAFVYTAATAGVLLLFRAAVLPAVAAANGPDAPGLGPHLVRIFTPREAFMPRRAETAIGERAAEVAKPEQRLLIADMSDYGYFAILAGSGRPWVFELERDLDPRNSQNTIAVPLETRLTQSGAHYVIAAANRPDKSGTFAAAPLATEGPFSLWRVLQASPQKR